jgi:undecaprenyl diphosphate synthase
MQNPAVLSGGVLHGRASETRTHDLFVPNEARYQLRYSPKKCGRIITKSAHDDKGTGDLRFLTAWLYSVTLSRTVSMPTPLRHLAIIMDGNRRWAKEKGLPSLQGHTAGYDTLKRIGDACLARGIEVLSVFAFSTENWKRTEEEVGYLMDLLEKGLRNELEEFGAKGLRIRVVGRRDGLRPSVLEAIQEAEEKTAGNTKATLCICLNYGGRTEIVDACKALVADGVPADKIDEAAITSRLYWPDMPEPDLIIRTSGEERISGFLLWEAAYSEFYWTQKHWPDFDEAELDKALEEFSARQRRYGK